MRQLFIKTNKDYLTDLPRYAFEGKIVVIRSELEAKKAVDVLRRSSILGIDTETRPSFKRGESHKVALLQVANEDICFLFRLNEIGVPSCICDLLNDENIIKVGISLHDDVLMLHRREPNLTPRNLIDLQPMAKRMGIEDMSLQKLYANVFHKRISKTARLSNWEADILTESQKVYAATDAVTCIQLYDTLKTLEESKAFQLIETNNNQQAQ